MVLISVGRLCLQGAPFMNSLVYYTNKITKNKVNAIKCEFIKYLIYIHITQIFFMYFYFQKQAKLGDSITLSIYGSLTVLGGVASFMLFLLSECGRGKEKRRMTNILSTVQQARSNVWHVQQQSFSNNSSFEDSRWVE